MSVREFNIGIKIRLLVKDKKTCVHSISQKKMDRENVFDIHTAALLCFALSAEMPWSPNAPLWPCAGLRRALKGEVGGSGGII